MSRCYRIRLADIELNYRFYDQDTCRYFHDFILGETDADPDLETTEEDMKKWAHLVPIAHTDAFLEQRLLILKLSNYLCRKSVCVIHACAVVWKGYAWLFAAPSGTGKTTLYRNWKSLLGEEIRVLCGDMPLILARPDRDVRIYPSPWNGKENFGSLIQAPLGGILYLSQDSVNVMVKMGIPDMAAPLYSSFMCVSDSEMTVRCLSKMEEKILMNVPVWHFRNRGDLDSAKVSSQTLAAYLREKEVWKSTD